LHGRATVTFFGSRRDAALAGRFGADDLSRCASVENRFEGFRNVFCGLIVGSALADLVSSNAV
jgi:hypothetical protein